MDNDGVGGEGPRRVDAGGESMITSLLVAIVLVNGEWREEGGGGNRNDDSEL